MRRQISIREAKRNLSRYLLQVERGSEFVVTRRGRPVALIGPVRKRATRRLSGAQRVALCRLFAAARPLGIGRWRREDLYSVP